MAKYGERSKKNLSTAHPKLQELFNEVIKVYDHSIICGRRGKEEQDQAVHEGRSKQVWPTSKHNSDPSHAVDAAPYPIDWNDLKRLYYFAGIVKGIASQKKIAIRWGGDWDGDNDFKDQTFNDLVHFELIGEGEVV